VWVGTRHWKLAVCRLVSSLQYWWRIPCLNNYSMPTQWSLHWPAQAECSAALAFTEQQLVTVVRNESSTMRTHEQGIRCNICLLTARVLRLAELIRLLLKHAIDQRCMHDQSIFSIKDWSYSSVYNTEVWTIAGVQYQQIHWITSSILVPYQVINNTTPIPNTVKHGTQAMYN
jgi:hypothetical protein